jgi:hypothetical protein
MPINSRIAADQWSRFRWNAENGHYKFLRKADMCDKFFIGLQWTQEDLNALKQARRPALTINKIISTVSTILGEQIYNRSEVLYRPAAGANAATADAMSKVFMQISQNNQLPWVRSDVFADGIIRSRGFYDVRMDFNDSMRGEVRIDQLNSKNVIIDPDAEEYDPDTWNDVFITKWLNTQDVAILYSEEDAKLLQTMVSGVDSYSYDSLEELRDRFSGEGLDTAYFEGRPVEDIRRNVRVLERQHRVLTKQDHFVDKITGDTRPVPDGWDREKIGRALQMSNNQVAVIKRLVKRIRWTVTADAVVLHDDWSPYKHLTPVPYFPYFIHGQTVGIVENLISSQELLNKSSSQELHIVNTTANSGWKLKHGALKNMSIEELEVGGAQTGLVLELDEVANAEKINPNQVPSGLDRISSKAEEHIKTISNVSDSMQGFDREDVAAKAIAYKQQRGSINLTKVLDNLTRSDWLLGRNVTDLIQGYYSEERLINITHDDVTREPEVITVNKFDEATGEIANDLTIGEYNLVITTTPYRASMEDSQFQQALELREMGIAIPDNVIIENSRLTRRADIIKTMNGDKESPAAQAAAALDMRERTAQVEKAELDNQETKSDITLKLARARSEDEKAKEAGPEGEIIAMQNKHALDMKALEDKFALDTRAQDADLALKKEKHDEEMRLMREKHDLEVAERKAAMREQRKKEVTSKPTEESN